MRSVDTEPTGADGAGMSEATPTTEEELDQYLEVFDRIIDAYADLGDMEREVLATIAERLLEGQRSYGLLRHGKLDTAKEAYEEACDMAVYTAVAMVELQKARQAFKAAPEVTRRNRVPGER